MSISLTSLDQMINFGLSILTMQVSKNPCFQEPKILFLLRIGYIVSNLIQLLFYFIIKKRILTVNDQRKLFVKKDIGLFQENTDVEETIEITYSEYDLKELNRSSKSALMQVVIVTILHLKWKIAQPLIVAISVPLRSLCLNPLYLRYIFGREVLRPFDLNVIFAKKNAEPAVEKKRKKEE